MESSRRDRSVVKIEKWRENRFYHYDADGIAAICHAIEVLASEEASGTLLSLIGQFAEFEPHRECYSQLAATIQAVQVFGTGRMPRPIAHLRFRKDARSERFRGVVYSGNGHQVAFIGESVAGADAWTGFYSVAPELVGRITDELAAPSPKDGAFREFRRLAAIDEAARQLEGRLREQREALDTAVRRLQVDGRYGAGHFASDVEKGITLLSQWKARVPQILARGERPQ